MTPEQQEALHRAMLTAGAREQRAVPSVAAFVVRTDCAIVTAYRSGKVLIQGRDIDATVQVVDRILGQVQVMEVTAVPFPVVGADESGKGDLFGPLVLAACVARDEGERRALVKAGARDCKLMSDEAVRLVAVRLREVAPWQVRVVLPEEYNVRYQRVRNVNVLLSELYVELLGEMARRTSARTVILDKYGGRAARLWRQPPTFQFLAETHAERYPEVAAASVLARDAFLEGLATLAQQYGLGILPKGASVDTQSLLAKVVADHGTEILWKIAKVNFAPVKPYLGSLFHGA
jgi:ribonuclease HIII